MKRDGRALQRPYETALRRHLKLGTAASLQSARKLGRRALALGLETLDLAQLHEQAFVSVIEASPAGSSAARNRYIKRAGQYFAQAILPMEETHRTAVQATNRLTEMNQALAQRTRELTATNRKLEKEIAKRKDAEESLRGSEEQSRALLAQSRLLQQQLRLLSRRVMSAQEEERKRVSRELHDVIAQMLTGINVRLATLKAEAHDSHKGLSQKISRTQRLVEKSVDSVHRFARELRPALLDDLGLIPALHSFLKGFTKETGIRTSLAACKEVEKLSSAKRTALYRIAQEALTNVARHAQAGRVDISIELRPGTVRMQIKDDGKAFAVDRMWDAKRSRHLGMLGMRERAEMVGGSFRVDSAPGKGTTVTAQVPFRQRQKESANP
jgi:signal transduction histidine kinase